MTHHMSYEVAVLASIVSLYLSLFALPISRGLAGERTEIPVSSLIEMLRNEDGSVRRATAHLLEVMGPEAKAAIPALIKALQQDTDAEVRRAAAQGLGQMGPEAKAAIPALIKALQQDTDARVRGSAAWALGWMMPEAKTAIPALIKALQQDTDGIPVRASAAEALRRMGPEAKTAIPALIKALQQDTDTTVRGHAAEALGQLGSEAKAAIPALIKALQDDGIRESAAPALTQIALALQDAGATEMIAPLKVARDTLMAYPDTRDSNDAATVRRAVDALEFRRRSHLKETLLQWMGKHPYLVAVLAAYPVLLLGLLACYQFRPLWLFRINESLKPYTDFALPARLGGVKLPLRYVLLVGFFQYNLRMLDAWVAQRLTIARAEFQRKTTVSDRTVHVPVPAILDGRTIPHLIAEPLRPTFERRRACLLIWGEGGAGKTSLACQVARWGMSETPTERLSAQHLMIPILIEHDLEPRDTGHPHPFLEAIRGELRVLTTDAEPIPEELVRQLLQQRRLLVMVDRFSEMSEATRQMIRPGHPEFPANALIVTSRLEERLDGVPKTTVKPLRIQGNRLSSFLEAYLTQRDKRQCFDDAEFFEACRHLSVMVGTRDLTVLLAKLYAEQMIAAKDGPAEETLPDTIPDLMLSYVNEVNRGVEPAKQEDRTVHRVAKVIAWECLKRTYRPSPAPREDVLAALRGEQDAEAVLAYLEDRLRLIQTVGAGRNQIRFALDPLAEYFAGLYLVETYGQDENAWREFLAQAEAMPGPPEARKGFLLAVRDCCLSTGSDAKVPDFIAVELSRRAGMDADIMTPNTA